MVLFFLIIAFLLMLVLSGLCTDIFLGIDYFPSSKRCGNCGHIVDKLPLNIREWECPKCATNHDRDINASQNILAAGLAVSVCGASVRPEESKSRKATALKQKPKS